MGIYNVQSPSKNFPIVTEKELKLAERIHCERKSRNFTPRYGINNNLVTKSSSKTKENREYFWTQKAIINEYNGNVMLKSEAQIMH